MTVKISEVIRERLGWCPNAGSFNGKGYQDTTDYPLPVISPPERPPSANLMKNRDNERYHNTQFGIIFSLALVIGVSGTIFDILTHGISGMRIVSVLFLLLMTGLLLTSTTLTVIVSDRLMKVYHGPVPLRKRIIPLSEIISVRVEEDARHTIKKAVWYLSPKRFTLEKGVVIKQSSGRTFWIGTDDPEVLVKAILSAQGGRDVHT